VEARQNSDDGPGVLLNEPPYSWQPFYQDVSCSCKHSVAVVYQTLAPVTWMHPLSENTAQRIADASGTAEARFGKQQSVTDDRCWQLANKYNGTALQHRSRFSWSMGSSNNSCSKWIIYIYGGPRVLRSEFSRNWCFGPACRIRDQHTTCFDTTVYSFIYNIYRIKNNVAQTLKHGCTIKTAADWNGRRPIRPRDKRAAWTDLSI